MAKRAAAGTLALAVCLTGGAALATSAQAATGFKFDTRLAGADRYQTAVEASKAAFPDGSDSVVIVNGDRTVDGLTASYVAGLHSAPILYVNSDGNTVSPETAAEIVRLKASKAYIVGGTTVVSRSLETNLRASIGTVVRYGGTDRFETASLVAASGSTKPSKVFVASGERFADALVAGPVAYKQHYPILLTSSTGVPSYTKAELADISAKEVKVVGGTAVVSDATYTAVGGTVRLAGESRQGTATQLADDAIKNEGFSKADVALVGNLDRNAADALVAAPFAGIHKTPLLFIDGGYAGAPTATYLKAHAADLTGHGYVFGGTTAVPQADVDDATAAAGAVTSNQSFSVTGGGSVALSKSVQYTVTGLGTGKVDIQLFDPANVDTSSSVVKFTGTNPGGTGNYALANSNTGKITIVNGNTASGSSAQNGVTPTNGSITFTVESAAAQSVVPVIFAQGNSGTTAVDDRLSLRADGTAAVAFGVGGKANFLKAEVTASGSFASVTATGVDKAYFTDGTNTYYYDATDTFQLVAGSSTTSISLAQFQSVLSAGDTISGYYTKSTDSGPSVFKIVDAAPKGPDTFSAATNATQGGVTLSFANSLEVVQGVTGYTIYRAPSIAATVTGGSVTCPAVSTTGTPAAPYAAVATVSSTPTAAQQTSVFSYSGGTYTYKDTSAAAGSDAANPNSYCYVISAVSTSADGSSKTGVGVQVTAIQKWTSAGTAAQATGAPKFIAGGTAAHGSTSITVNYNQPIKTASVDKGDFVVTYVDDAGVSTALTVSGVTATNVVGTGNGQVVLTLANAAPAASAVGKVIIHAQTSATDNDTVLSADTTPVAQPATDAVQIAVS